MNVVVEDAISTTSGADSPATVLPPDETLIEILHWLPTAKDCVAWGLTCRRLHKVIHQDVTVLPRLVQSRGIPLNISTWEQLAWYERLCQHNLLNENRIGFDWDSDEIEDPGVDENDDDSDDNTQVTDVRGNIERITNVRDLMKEFPRMRVTVDAHCGAGPFSGANRIAPRLRAVLEALTRHEYSRGYDDDGNRYASNETPGISINNSEQAGEQEEERNFARRITLNGWGGTIFSQGAETYTHPMLVGASMIIFHQEPLLAPSTHPYAALAQLGRKGWVLLRLELDGIELPELPDFYIRHPHNFNEQAGVREWEEGGREGGRTRIEL